MSKLQRKETKISVGGRPPRATTHLTKEELKRVDELRVGVMAGRGQSRPDVQSTLELIYLRILGRVEDRGKLAKQLKELKTLLDQAGSLMNEIMDEADKSSSKK